MLAKIVSNAAVFKTFFQSKILVWFKIEKVKQKCVNISSFDVSTLRRFQIENTLHKPGYEHISHLWNLKYRT